MLYGKKFVPDVCVSYESKMADFWKHRQIGVFEIFFGSLTEGIFLVLYFFH